MRGSSLENREEGGDFFASNIEVLAARLPGLADLLRESALLSFEGLGLELSASPKGFPVARLHGLYLHSGYDPEGESARLAASLPLAADTAILLGFGLGYVAEALLRRVDRILVCEAEARLLVAALRTRDLRSLLAHEGLCFIVGGPAECAISALDEMGTRRYGLLALKAAESAYPDWYGLARRSCERYASKESINENTLRRFGRLWVRNLAKNLMLIGELPGTARLEARFSGLPALVLAAGPSLDEVLPQIHELRKRCLLVCVDTALRSVLRAGLEPDFLVVVDPQYWNWRHLEGLAAPRSILVSESAAWPAVFRFECRAAFLCSSLFPLGKAIESGVAEKGRLGAGGSVATTAWDLARVLGARPIYFAGLDLSFPRAATHAKASLFEQRSLSSGRRLAPAETSQAAALFSAGPLWASANDGGSVRTDARMNLYAWWFESRLARPDSPPSSSLSQGGLAIPGLSLARIEDILALPCRRAEIDLLLEGAASMVEEGEAREAATAALSALLASLEEAYASATIAVSEAAAARADLAEGRDPSRRLALLDRIDLELLSGGAGDVLGFLLPPLAEILGNRAHDLAEGLSISEGLYRKVADSALYHLEILRSL